MDNTDERILDIMKGNARISFQELGEKLDAIEASQKQDASHTLLSKISFGMVIAVLVIQVLEGMGLIAMLMTVMR